MPHRSSAPRVPVTQLQRVDVLDLRLDRTGANFVGGMLVLVEPDAVKLIDGARKVRVALVTSRSTYGSRRWFACPNCSRRARIVVRRPGEHTWGCYQCARVTYPSRLRGKSRAYQLHEQYHHRLERARATHRRHPRSGRATARYLQALDDYMRARRAYLEWIESQVDALARKVS